MQKLTKKDYALLLESVRMLLMDWDGDHPEQERLEQLEAFLNRKAYG